MLTKINWDYLKQIKDIYTFFKCFFIRTIKSKEVSNSILIVDPCLVGDFMASLPAIHSFIKNHSKYNIDLVVTPPLKELAQRIKGIRNVYISKSSTIRDIELENIKNKTDMIYNKIVLMRMSDDAYNLIRNIKSKKILNPFFKIIKYQYLLPLRGKMLPRREIDCFLLDEKYKKVSFEDLFNFNEKDYQNIRKLKELQTKDKIVIIHTGSTWIMKQWMNERWVELIKKINDSGKFRFIFVGAKHEKSDFEEISKKLDFKVYSLIDKINLKDLMLVLRESDYLIGVDSGPRNMAHIADLRSVTMSGSGLNLFMPLSKKDIFIDKSDGNNLFHLLFHSKNNHMHKITVEEVYNSLMKHHKKK